MLNDWGYNSLIDGWTESERYGSKIVEDFGARKTGQVIAISKDYPVQMNKADKCFDNGGWWMGEQSNAQHPTECGE